MKWLLGGASTAPPTTSETTSPWRSFGLIRAYFRDHWGRLAAGLAALVIVDLLQLLVPRVIKEVVDDLQQGRATDSGLLRHVGVIVALALIIGALRFVWRLLLLGFSRLVERDLRNRFFSHLLLLDRPFFQRRTTGEIMALATNDLSSVQLATGMGVVAAADAVFMGIAAFAFMAYIDPVLTLVAISPMPVLALLTRVLSSRLHQRFSKVQEQFSHITELARSTFSTIRIVQAYNQEQPQSDRFDAMGRAYVRDNLRLAMIYGTLFPISGFIGNIGLLLVLALGGRMTIRGDITTGDFVAFINYLYLMTWPMMALGWVADLFQRGITSLNRIDSLFQEAPTLVDAPSDPMPPPLTGSIRIQDLTFTYPRQDHPALEHVDLDIPAGTFMGVVGRTGSGKTTLCHLLARLYPVPEGAILMDGRDVNRLSLADVRRAMAYVPQDVILFSETIAFNIAMGRADAAMEEIEGVARAAAIHDEIAAMKDGYQTRIGERGVKLSGGQRQRLAIARALLLDRPIIIIDDGLSAVDMETERAILRSIAPHLRGKTAIVVSHRVAPLADAHTLVVMERGSIVARGSHEELLRTSRYYRTIYEQQTRNGP
ncbi:MAG: ABC transporter ATP-binding protein/permease [Syntrophobacteraceae bacterium]|nr:ABC transporter ATP-binding protein/permease [Syntrophobacteraceae bacterium]MCU0587515.1 ABC transporter ATP-binding protein/permease [Syntrophobacteraceae bacterium]